MTRLSRGVWWAAVVGALVGCHKPAAPMAPAMNVFSCKSPNGSCRESLESAEFQQDCADKGGTYAKELCPKEGLLGSCALVVDKGPKKGQAFSVMFYRPTSRDEAAEQCVRHGGKFIDKR